MSFHSHDQKGQSAVEYVLLLAVIVFFISILFNSAPMKRFFGTDSSYFNFIKRSLEHSYRHGYEYARPQNPAEQQITDDVRYSTGRHESYFYLGTTRFFLVQEYPALR